MNDVFKKEVEVALDKVRPMLENDGGGVDLIDAKDGIVTVHLTGACNGCPMANMTLKLGIEKLLVEEIKDFKELRAV